ncbi:MAG: DUF402 domain-containing protein [Mycoplasma sp.]
MKTNNKGFRIGDCVSVHAYKYNGWLYRTWDLPMIIFDNDEYVVLASNHTSVITSEFKTRRYFHSQNPHQIYWIFYKKKWFNILISVKKNKKIQYYVNIASKFLVEEDALKYIDFEIDFKIFPNSTWIEVDKKEFQNAIQTYNYPDVLVERVETTEKELISMCESKIISETFNKEKLDEFNEIYNRLITEKG